MPDKYRYFWLHMALGFVLGLGILVSIFAFVATMKPGYIVLALASAVFGLWNARYLPPTD